MPWKHLLTDYIYPMYNWQSPNGSRMEMGLPSKNATAYTKGNVTLESDKTENAK